MQHILDQIQELSLEAQLARQDSQEKFDLSTMLATLEFNTTNMQVKSRVHYMSLLVKNTSNLKLFSF